MIEMGNPRKTVTLLRDVEWMGSIRKAGERVKIDKLVGPVDLQPEEAIVTLGHGAVIRLQHGTDFEAEWLPKLTCASYRCSGPRRDGSSYCSLPCEEDPRLQCPSECPDHVALLECQLDLEHDDSHKNVTGTRVRYWTDPVEPEADPSDGLVRCTFKGPFTDSTETATGAELDAIGAALSPPVPRIVEPDEDYRDRLGQAEEEAAKFDVSANGVVTVPRSADRPEEVANGIQVCDEKNCCQLRRVGIFCSEHAGSTEGLE